MAALAAVLGASYGGKRAMTATSGPGFSLMTELIGLSSMAELPAVIVDAQRAGPSTGMPTKMEQSDLSFALHAGHGDAPRMIVAPASVADCYNLIILAFQMAERYQMPVLFLTDQSLTARVESVDAHVFQPVEVESAPYTYISQLATEVAKMRKFLSVQLPLRATHAMPIPPVASRPPVLRAQMQFPTLQPVWNMMSTVTPTMSQKTIQR